MVEPRLLVIEDNEGIAKLVCHIAGVVGFEARAIERGAEITSVYGEFEPEVIVLDILIPDMDGFEILQYLHTCKSESRVVILSGDMDYRPMAGRIATGLNINVAANIAKPFRAHELISALETIKFSLHQGVQAVSARMAL